MKTDNGITAIVTSGASGLGEAAARTLAATQTRVAKFELNATRSNSVAASIGACSVKSV